MKQRILSFSRGYSSNSKIFENRGDPWVSDREGRETYGREEYENPDLDRYLRAGKAPTKNPDRVISAPKPREVSAKEAILRRHQSKTLDIANGMRLGIKPKSTGGF